MAIILYYIILYYIILYFSNDNETSYVKAISHQAEFSARREIFFCLKTSWRRVGVKRQKEISFRVEKVMFFCLN